MTRTIGAGVAVCLLAAGAILPAGPAFAGVAAGKESKPADGTASHDGIVVSGAFLPLPPSAAVASAYFVIRNQTGRADMLISADTTVASQTMAMSEKATSMAMLGPVTIPAHGRVEFAPGHDHLMLQGLRHSLKVGQHVAVRLTFRHAGTIRLSVPVVPLDRILGTAGPQTAGGGQHATHSSEHRKGGK